MYFELSLHRPNKDLRLLLEYELIWTFDQTITFTSFVGSAESCVHRRFRQLLELATALRVFASGTMAENLDDRTLDEVSNSFWANQGASYPNYGTTKKRRLHEINYLMSQFSALNLDSVRVLVDVGCGTGSTVTILQELTDIEHYFCYDISMGMMSIIDTRSVRGAQVTTSELDISSLDPDFEFPDADIVLCFGLFQCLSDEAVRTVLSRLRGKRLFVRDACYLPHQGRQDINTFSEQLRAKYSCRYRTLLEYISLCTSSDWQLKDVRRAFPDEIESAFDTKQWFLHLERTK